jgi:methylenetetrahydrofolate dehydrogenase (NADP+)/methenyltetrahydrofolate cyclohydrolase
MRLLDEYRVQVAGRRAVVIGRSSIVGKPMALLLMQANATVSICHSQTVDMARLTTDADILVAAVGATHLVSADMVKVGATVIDVGMNRTDEGLFGDVDPGAAELAEYMTPVPGGVGPMTRALLLANAVKAARARRAPLARARH